MGRLHSNQTSRPSHQLLLLRTAARTSIPAREETNMKAPRRRAVEASTHGDPKLSPTARPVAMTRRTPTSTRTHESCVAQLLGISPTPVRVMNHDRCRDL